MYSKNRRNGFGKPKCGEIWMCSLSGKDGSVQDGYRPVFILSNDRNNTYSTTVNVIPLTTKMNKRHLPVHVELWDYERYGLKAPSTIMVEQTTTVSAWDLDAFVGIIKDRDILEEIRKAMLIQFPIDDLISVAV